MSSEGSQRKEYSGKPWRDEDILHELYIEEGLTLVEVSNRLGCNKGTVCKWVEKLDVREDDSWKDEKTLRTLFVERGLSIPEIANQFGTTRGTIHYWLDEFGIEKYPWRGEERLEHLYLKEKLSPSEIAEQLDTTRQTIHNWLDEHDIERDDPWDDKDVLRRLYIEEGLTTHEIGRKLGCGSNTVRRRLHKFDIPIYTQTPDGLKDREYLVELYQNQGLYLEEIAEKLDTCVPTVWRWMEEHEIKRRPGPFQPGEDNPRWTGGNGDWYYGPNWPEQREKALERAGYQCQVCGLSGEEHAKRYNGGIHVHHVISKEEFRDEDGVLDYESANRLRNLVALCAPHHQKWERVPLRPQFV